MAVGNRLSDMEFDEISLVTRPANQLSKVVLYKSDTTEENMTENVTQADEAVEKDDEAVVADSVVIPQEVYEYIEALEEANADLVAEVEKASRKRPMMMDDEEVMDDEEEDMMKGRMKKDDEELLKSADPRLVAIVKSANERAEMAETIAKAERSIRLEREFVSKAQTLDHLPITAEDFGIVLKSVAEAVDAETFEKVWQVLEAANAGMAQGGIFKEVGKSVSTDADGPATLIDKAAARIREQNPDLTEAQAIAKAIEHDPTLYTAYLNEVK